MEEIKKIRSKEEEKSRMLNTFLPRPSYSRWIMKRREKRKWKNAPNMDNTSKEETSSEDEGKIISMYYFIQKVIIMAQNLSMKENDNQKLI